MFKTRLLSGIVLVVSGACSPLSAAATCCSSHCLAVSLIGMRELYRAMKVRTDEFNAVCWQLPATAGAGDSIMRLMAAGL